MSDSENTYYGFDLCVALSVVSPEGSRVQQLSTGVLRALGSEVTLVALENRVLEFFDPMIGEVLMAEMRRQGIELRMGFQVAGLARTEASMERLRVAGIQPVAELLGLDFLPLRMERHSKNAFKVAEYLENHPRVEWVSYPGLPSNPAYERNTGYLKHGFGGMVVFGIKGGADAGSAFVENLKLFSHVANVGDAKSLVIHPASTTHQQLSESELAQAGVDAGMVRLSIGMETTEDLIWDLDQALQAISA